MFFLTFYLFFRSSSLPRFRSSIFSSSFIIPFSFLTLLPSHLLTFFFPSIYGIMGMIEEQ